MNIVEKLKKEPRMIFAFANFISFFLPWIALKASASAEVMGETISSDSVVSMTGFGVTEYSMLGIIFYLLPIIMFAIPFVKQVQVASRYLYLIFPIIALILMFTIGALVNGAAGGTSTNVVEYTTDIDKLIGYWIALICNIGILIFTLMKDFNIKSGEDLKRNIQQIDVENLSAQVSTMAKDISDNVQKSIYIECPNCKNKVQKGKRFCSKCGNEIPQKRDILKLKCHNCGSEISEGKKFCPDCGMAVPIKKEAEISKPLNCMNCGSEIPEGKKFCSDCGTPIPEIQKSKLNIPIQCSNCGSEIPKEKKFCPDCGTKVNEE